MSSARIGRHEAGLGSKKRGNAAPPFHGISKITLKVVVFHLRREAPTYTTPLKSFHKVGPSIAFRYVLHRCESRDIRCRESFRHTEDDEPPARSPSPGRRGNALSFKFLGAIHAGVRYARKGRPSGSAGARRARRPPPGRWGRGAARPPAPERRNVFSGRSAMQVSTMILPQGHLRKPCYDFSFL